MIKLFPTDVYVTFVRNPVDQYTSNYAHYLSNRATNFEPGIGQLEPNLTFEDFILHPKMKNYQSKFVTADELENFDLVGLQEKLEESVTKLSELMGIVIPFNKSVINGKRHKIVPTKEQKELIKKTHTEDMKLYKRAKELFKEWKI